MTDDVTKADIIPFPDLGRADGPWSRADAPKTQALVSFGPIWVPAFPTLHASIEIDPKSKRAGAVSIQVEDCRVQLKVYAAPRGVSIWGDIRRGITQNARAAGGTSQVVEGPWGPELIVTLPVLVRPGVVPTLTQRYIGIEGDRWMIRASVSGASALTDVSAARIYDLLSRCAVERGDEAVSPGAVMELRFPEGQGAPLDPAEAPRKAVSLSDLGIDDDGTVRGEDA
jgi:hypothetical protein